MFQPFPLLSARPCIFCSLCITQAPTTSAQFQTSHCNPEQKLLFVTPSLQRLCVPAQGRDLWVSRAQSLPTAGIIPPINLSASIIKPHRLHTCSATMLPCSCFITHPSGHSNTCFISSLHSLMVSLYLFFSPRG